MLSARRSILFLTGFFLLAAFSSCDPQKKLLKSKDTALKLRKADEFYARKKYQRAAELYDDVVRFYRATPAAEDIYYKLAMSHFYDGQYLVASYELRQFIENYPISMHTEDAYFHYAETQYKQSGDVDLDQSNTLAAINSFQLFLDHFPNTDRVDEVNKRIDILRAKLETRAYNNALLYYKIRNYRASVVAVRNFLNDYPSAPNRDYLEWIVVKSYYEYAKASVETKKTERFYNAIQASLEFSEKYAKSKYLADVLHIRQISQQEINTLNHTKK